MNQLEDAKTNSAIQQLRLTKAEYKKAYALAITNKSIDKYQVLRSFMAVGNIAGSNEVLKELQPDNPDYFLDKARLHNMLGEWERTLEECEKGMKLNLSPLYLMTYLQVASVANYELGHYQESLISINKIESLGFIQSAPTLLFYNKLLKTKIEHLTSNINKDLGDIQLILNQIITNNLLNLDTLLAWLRCKIDLMRMLNLPHAQYSNAALAVSRQLGDQLYHSLAQLDHQVASHDLQHSFQSSFERVAKIRDEVLAPEAKTTTARLMQNYLKFGKKEQRIKNTIVNDVTKTIVLSDINLSINLEPFSFHFHAPKEKSINALKVLYRGDTSKEVFFKYLWNHQYADHLHNNLIRTLISRMRKTFSVEIKSSKSVLSLKDTIVC